MSEQQTQTPSLNGWNVEFLEEMYRAYRTDKSSVDEKWQVFFQGFELGLTRVEEGSGDGSIPVSTADSATTDAIERQQSRVDSLIYHYRDIGHLLAKLDPLGRNTDSVPNLELEAFELDESQLDKEFLADRLLHGPDRMKLRDIINTLKSIYCQSIGVEYMHIQNTTERRWLQRRMEGSLNRPELSKHRKLRIAKKLFYGEAFERFLHTNYVGQKRFSLEGAETLIPLLDTIIEKCGEQGAEEIVMGMAHRGRLNVLANIMGKSYETIFSEFEDNYEPGQVMGDGDVKYHKGYSNDWKTEHGKTVHLTLTANPSHLEAVDPVVEGRCRGKQRILGDTERRRCIPVLMHGDAAFAGQGIVAEIFNFSQLKGYFTGGTIHVVINNQIGFTTLPEESRSSRYCTDVAKMVQAPIFHVNADDPEAVLQVAEIAVEFRQEFRKDVVIDLVCYRRLGHNEADEPALTTPRLYALIRNHPSTYELYTKALLEDGAVTQADLDQIASEMNQQLEAAQDRAKNAKIKHHNGPVLSGQWKKLSFQYNPAPVDTAVPQDMLVEIANVWNQFPENFNVNRVVKRVLNRRWETISQGKGIDWATGEGLAFGSLLLEGTGVRLTGQDSRRGTFSQRHAVIWDTETAAMDIPLMRIRSNQDGRFCVYDSPLSEASVLGFDYGYSLANPDMLILWEAQFGDFVNGAQVIIDQFIVSSESKWGRSSGIVLLLPHGYEGQGPEHSNGWMDRFLALYADQNIQVCNMTTPAQYFHVLRRQMKRDFRKPLIIMSPKSLLRHAQAVSDARDFTAGTFQEVLDDPEPRHNTARRVVLCSGKVYYDLLAYRAENGTDDVALLRVEQVAPYPEQQLSQIIARYEKAEEIVWCQEEPMNRGAWTFLEPLLRKQFGDHFGEIRYAGRAAAASPAVGSMKRHLMDQARLIEAAFSRIPEEAPVKAVVTPD